MSLLLKVEIDYPQREEEMAIIELNMGRDLPDVKPIVSLDEIVSGSRRGAYDLCR